MRERDKAMMGMLKHIGIEKGKPYNPDEKTKEIFRRAVIDAYYYMQQRYLTVEPRRALLAGPALAQRLLQRCQHGLQLGPAEGMLDYDNRSIHPWFTAIYFPAKVTARPPTMYLATARDKDGNLFKAGKTYALTVPKDVPINKFWSLTVYDMETWAFIYTPEERPGLSSREIRKMKQNADGSVTLYVGPKAPEGLREQLDPDRGQDALPDVPLLRSRGGLLQQDLQAGGRGAGQVVHHSITMPERGGNATRPMKDTREGVRTMRTENRLACILLASIVIATVNVSWAQPPKMKMTTDIPASITAPDRVKTSIGTLEYFDGVPQPKTVDTVYDYLDRSRAVRCSSTPFRPCR